MKKLLIYLLFFFLWFLFPSRIFSACSPPTDYSSCPVAQIGPKIAANIDPKNYQQIREQYNQANPAVTNQQIPVTIIYTTSDLNPTNLSATVANLQAMQQYGLHPIIRISSSVIGTQGWDRITPQEAQNVAQTLNQALSLVHFSQKPIVFFGNEPNLPEEWGGQVDTSSFAQAFAAFIQSAGTNRQFKIFFPPVASHQEGAEYAFLQQILNYRLPSGATIGQSVDGATLTIYNNNSQTLSALYQQLTQFYQQNGIGNFAISEIGPLINGRLLQNQGDISRWTSIMSQVFRDFINNPRLFSGAQFITTSFFLDTNGDGFPDRTLLVIIDKDGNVIIMELATLGGGILTSQKYGECEADQPFLGGPITKGNSFEIKITSCFSSVNNPSERIQALLKTINLDFPNNQKIAVHLHQNTLKKLTPPSYTPVVQKKSALGKITYEVCEKGTSNWFNVENEVEFKTPEWMNQMADTGEELAKMLLPSGSNGFSFKNSSLASFNPQEKILGETSSLLAQAQEAGTIPHGCKYFYADNYGDCSCLQKGTCRGEHGCCPNHWWWGICGWEDCQPENRCSQGDLQRACPGEFLGRPTGPTPPPTPKMCEDYSPQGESLTPEVVCVSGNCILKDRVGNPANSLFNSLIQAGLSITQALQEVLSHFSFPICSTKNYIVTPIIQTPYVFQADNYLRNAAFSIFKVPNNDTQESFELKHAIQNSTQGSEASPLTSYSSEVEIFGQAGVKNSYEWVQKALLPPQIYSSPALQFPPSHLTNIPFRESSVVISVLNKEKVVEKVLESWPKSKIKEQWDFVYRQAVSHNWNPAFVIALWIEESGASGVDAYDLGCLGAPANNLSSQLECLFSRPYANSSFEEFMCQYSEGKSAPCEFILNPNFPRNLEYWYFRLTL